MNIMVTVETSESFESFKAPGRTGLASKKNQSQIAQRLRTTLILQDY
jgi:hypothetical protein